MSLLTEFLGAYFRSGLRGSTRLTDYLSRRLKALQNLEIDVVGGTIFADLRNSSSRALLANKNCSSGEDIVMKRFVRAGDIVYDVGAHLGFFSLLMAMLVGENGRVVAFEPNPELLPSLKKTLGRIPNAELHEIALSNESGSLDLFVPEDASMASLSNWTDGIGGEGPYCTMQDEKN